MSTGLIESWGGKISDIGPMYPFVGAEFLLFIVCLVLWIVWHIVQIKGENKQLMEESKNVPSADVRADIENNL